mmetsp:Transcript_78612/g.227218  ORF Transcript_78612/g.227218 Transcript_78612/m.227218 type:complete len:214 (+) Transcript_78612:335-976(+)
MCASAWIHKLATTRRRFPTWCGRSSLVCCRRAMRSRTRRLMAAALAVLRRRPGLPRSVLSMLWRSRVTGMRKPWSASRPCSAATAAEISGGLGVKCDRGNETQRFARTRSSLPSLTARSLKRAETPQHGLPPCRRQLRRSTTALGSLRPGMRQRRRKSFSPTRSKCGSSHASRPSKKGPVATICGGRFASAGVAASVTLPRGSCRSCKSSSLK